MKNLFIVLMFAGSAHSFAQTQIQIRSPWDNFTLQRSAGDYQIDGAKIQSNHLNPLLTILSSPTTAPCADEFKGEIQITITNDQGSTSNSLNLKEGILKSQTGCLLISGPGLDGFPVHRSWLTGPFEKNLNPQKSLAFVSKGIDFQIVKNKDEWTLRKLNPVFNHEFADQFRNSLRDFKIDRFIHLDALEGKPEAKLLVDGKTLRIFQVAPTTWAMQDDPKKPWAMISSNWSIWKSLDKDQWTDPHSSGIAALLSRESSQERKQKQIETFGGTWSESLKLAYQTCLLSDDNSTETRLLCMHKLKQRPTNSNFRAVLSLLDKTDDERLLTQAGLFLQIKNPKGPRFTKKTDPLEFKRSWRKWWADSKL